MRRIRRFSTLLVLASTLVTLAGCPRSSDEQPGLRRVVPFGRFSMARGELPGGRETWELILQNDRKGLSLLLKHGNGTTTMGPSPPEVVVRGVEALSVASNVNFQRDHAFVFGFSAEPVANIRIELKTRPAIGVRPIDAPGFPFNVFVRQLGALGETPVIAALDAGGNVLHRETKPGKSGSANTVPP